MGDLDKFTTDGVIQLFKHNGRYHKNNSNKDINPLKTCLNYSFTETSNDIKQAENIFHEEMSKSYLYGRNTKREVDAITACGWVFTLPKEVSDYSTISKDNIAYINPEKEKLFLKEYTILFQQGMALYFMIAFIMMKRLNHIYIYILYRALN